MNVITKTKAQRQQWYKAMTPEQQAEYLERVCQKKAKRRLKRLLEETKTLAFDCKKCLHGIGRHCNYILENGCTDFYAIKYV